MTSADRAVRPSRALAPPRPVLLLLLLLLPVRCNAGKPGCHTRLLASTAGAKGHTCRQSGQDSHSPRLASRCLRFFLATSQTLASAVPRWARGIGANPSPPRQRSRDCGQLHCRRPPASACWQPGHALRGCWGTHTRRGYWAHDGARRGRNPAVLAALRAGSQRPARAVYPRALERSKGGALLRRQRRRRRSPRPHAQASHTKPAAMAPAEPSSVSVADIKRGLMTKQLNMRAVVAEFL